MYQLTATYLLHRAPLTSSKFSALGPGKYIEWLGNDDMANEFGERVLSIDNSLWRTYIDLWRKPDEVIRGFLGGLRKRYFNALNYFTLGVTVSGFQVFVMKKFYPDTMNVLYNENVQFAQMLNDGLIEYQPVVLFSTIPILALLAYVSFMGLKKYNYTEQLIIQLYTYSHLAIHAALLGILFMVLGMNYIFLSVLTIPLYLIYNTVVYKKLYALNWGGILVRLALFVGVSMVLYIITVIVTLILVFAFYGLEGGHEFFTAPAS